MFNRSINALWNSLTKLQWVMILLFSSVIFLSLDMTGKQVVLGAAEYKTIYQATIRPANDSKGPVKVVFYRENFEEYSEKGLLRLPAYGWNIETFGDYTTLTAEHPDIPAIYLFSTGQQLLVGLKHYSGAGTALLIDGNYYAESIPLHSGSEFVSTYYVGGWASDIPRTDSEVKHYSVAVLTGTFILILVLLTLIAQFQLWQFATKHGQQTIGRKEIVYFALPLFVSTLIYQLSYWPGNVAYDASLQWHEAVTRGRLNEAIGIIATLFMRLFSLLSDSPASLIVFQSALGALGVSLILREFRYIGVSRWAAQLSAITLGILPQYPTFFTNLGKDALSALGIIFMAWSVLFIARNIEAGRIHRFSIVVFIVAAFFAAVMRINVLPAAIFVVVAMAIYLFMKGHKTTSLWLGAIFILALVLVPKIVVSFSVQPQLQKVSAKNKFPLGTQASIVISHLFAAAVYSGIPLREKDAEVFYRLAPRRAWANYHCFMTDTTGSSIQAESTMTTHEFGEYMADHQLDLAAAVLRIIKDNPSIVFDRQLCITEMLWYTGYGKKPFQTTTTLGYDNVTEEFKSIVGENKSLVGSYIRQNLEEYFLWTVTSRNFWLFWKPALIFYLGLFSVLLRLTMQRDNGLLFMLTIPILLTVVMAVLIPFPAYRYQYPATLLMMLLCTLPFSSSDSKQRAS